MKIFGLLLTWILSCVAAFAQQTPVPIVEMKFGGLLGGVQNGRWLAPAKVGPKMKGKTEFLLVGWRGVEEGGVTLGEKGETEDVCQDFYRFKLDLEMDQGVAIGTNAKWNPAPRKAVAISLSNPVYKSVIANFLKKKGIAKPVVKITQAYRIDLEGDGTDEVLLSATNYKSKLVPTAQVGEYSFVLLRKTVGKTVTDHLLVGDFITKKIDFGAPSTNEISAVADLNGDGKMEIVLHGSYYEGDFASAFEMRAGKPVEIRQFRIGCGL
jgi:hypothetical protein